MSTESWNSKCPVNVIYTPSVPPQYEGTPRHYLSLSRDKQLYLGGPNHYPYVPGSFPHGTLYDMDLTRYGPAGNLINRNTSASPLTDRHPREWRDYTNGTFPLWDQRNFQKYPTLIGYSFKGVYH